MEASAAPTGVSGSAPISIPFCSVRAHGSFMGGRRNITIRRDLVPEEDRVYRFTDPHFIGAGQTYIGDDGNAYAVNRNQDAFPPQTGIGQSVGHTAGLAHVDFGQPAGRTGEAAIGMTRHGDRYQHGEWTVENVDGNLHLTTHDEGRVITSHEQMVDLFNEPESSRPIWEAVTAALGRNPLDPVFFDDLGGGPPTVQVITQGTIALSRDAFGDVPEVGAFYTAVEHLWRRCEPNAATGRIRVTRLQTTIDDSIEAEIIDDSIGFLTRQGLQDALALMRPATDAAAAEAIRNTLINGPGPNLFGANMIVTDVQHRPDGSESVSLEGRFLQGNPNPQFMDISHVNRPADRIRGLQSNAVIYDETEALSPEILRHLADPSWVWDRDYPDLLHTSTHGTFQVADPDDMVIEDDVFDSERDLQNGDLLINAAGTVFEVINSTNRDCTFVRSTSQSEHIVTSRCRQIGWLLLSSELDVVIPADEQTCWLYRPAGLELRQRMEDITGWCETQQHPYYYPQREAIDSINSFTRRRMREDGLYRRILPPLQIANDELDRSVPTNIPVRELPPEGDNAMIATADQQARLASARENGEDGALTPQQTALLNEELFRRLAEPEHVATRNHHSFRDRSRDHGERRGRAPAGAGV